MSEVKDLSVVLGYYWYKKCIKVKEDMVQLIKYFVYGHLNYVFITLICDI